MRKSYSRNFETSPLFNFANSELSAGETQLIDLELDNSSIKKYLPLNNVNVQNNSGQNIEVIFNQNEQKKFFMPNGTIISFDESVIPAVNYISIKNRGSTTITAGTVNITTYRKGVTEETVIQNVHKRLFAKKSMNLI